MERSYTVAEVWIRDEARCECGNCEWQGRADETEEIGDCALTPGDPSPAGRCPECQALVYPMEGEKVL